MHAVAAIACLGAAAMVASGAEVHVGAGRTHAALAVAIAAAAPGDTVIVHGGRYAEGALLISKPVTLIGTGEPVLDGEFKSEIIIVTASDVTIRGFNLRDGGFSTTRELAGIRIESASRVTVAGNRLSGCNYGVYLAKARDCAVLDNVIEGRMDNESNSGNGIHLWSCEGGRIAGNRISGHRDGIYLEFSGSSSVEGNEVAGNLRYGLHFMSSHGSRYLGNRFSRNGAGVAVMYSRDVEMTGNVFEFSWGGSSYGLLIKDLTDSRISGNTFHHNSTAIYSQGATRVAFTRNEFRENGWALRILADGGSNTIEGNNFVRNSFDVATNGRLSDHEFARNYWDRYEGYDLNHDGVGDVPFRPVSLFSTLVERVPASVLLIRSFMMHLMDRAEKALPSLTPEGVLDGTPARRPHAIPDRAMISPGKPQQP